MRDDAVRVGADPAAFARWSAAYVLLNAPFWWWGTHYFLSRPLFNVELFVPLLLMSWRRWLGWAALATCWFLDIVVNQAVTFYFVSPLDFLRSTKDAGHLAWHDYFTLQRLSIAAPFVVAAWVTPHLVPRGLRGRGWALLLPVLLSIFDVLNGSSMASLRSVRLFNINVAGSPTITLASRALHEGGGQPLKPLAPSASTRSLVDIEAWARSHPDRSVVLVLVESLGRHDAQQMRDTLQGRLWDPVLADRYLLSVGLVPFHGSTTNGELRELCGVSGSYRMLLSDHAPTPDCLPRRLAAAGWTTTGLHGFSEDMFARSRWWPALGFQRMFFAEQLLTGGEPQCGGAFRGACDADLIHRAFEMAAAPRQFVYVLTLNSHLPVAPVPVPPEFAAACAGSGVDDADCELNVMLARTLAAVRAGAAATTVANAPLIVIVGDHAPPFAERAIRARYSQVAVPAFVLMPKN